MEPEQNNETDLIFTTSASLKAGETRWESDLNGVVPMGLPPDFGGAPENRTPEHLLGGALVNCTIAMFGLLAQQSGLAYESIDGTARLHMAKLSEDGPFWMPKCEIALTIHGCADVEKASEIVEKAHAGCPVANSVKTEVALSHSFA